MTFKVIDGTKWKALQSKNCNYLFNRETGLHAVWGKTKDEDPTYSPYGPFILDIEVTTKCSGVGGKLCPACYKSNTCKGDNMSLDTFKRILDAININNTLTQLAFGLGSTGEENPDVWEMCDYSRSKGIVPNGTVADISDETADKIVNKFGACAISYHSDKDICYDSIKKLTDRGLKQTNMHLVVYKEALDEIYSVIDDIAGGDKRLSKLNAVIFLSLKKKGRAENKFTQLSQDEFESIINYAVKKKINYGMDSCTATKYLKFLDKNEEHENQRQFVEPCESSLFSSYVDVFGKFHPCSFCEKSCSWPKGADILKINNFVDDIWNGDTIKVWRDKLLSNNRDCFEYEV